MINHHDEFEAFSKNVGLLLLIDHAGRAGNAFFQTIFDKHPEVVTCPWIHYVYSGLTDRFGDRNEYTAQEAIGFIESNLYVSTIYHDLSSESRHFISKMGGDADAVLDRKVIRETIRSYLRTEKSISRRTIILLIYFSFLKGRNLDTSKIKYMLTADSISLRSESLHSGYSGKIVEFAKDDFENFKLLHLLRDPRAGFTSSVHQFVNQLGNMYGINQTNFFNRFFKMLVLKLDWDSYFVFGFWILYFKETFKTIEKIKSKIPNCFVEIKNEDLNLRFSNTLGELSKTLDISFLDSWSQNEKFVPTMLGVPWLGTGAYNNSYSQDNILKGDHKSILGKIAGPNKYVTRRWRDRLPKRDLNVIEYEFKDEITLYDYKFVTNKKPTKLNARLSLFLPLMGEIPSISWFLKAQEQINYKNKIIFFLSLPITYLFSRLSFLILLAKLDKRF